MENNLEVQENEEEMESAANDLEDEEEEYIEFMEDPLQGPSRIRPCPYVPADRLRIRVEPSTSRAVNSASGNRASSVGEEESSNTEADPNAFKWLEGPHPLLIPDVCILQMFMF
jgi:hypothetical protein